MQQILIISLGIIGLVIGFVAVVGSIALCQYAWGRLGYGKNYWAEQDAKDLAIKAARLEKAAQEKIVVDKENEDVKNMLLILFILIMRPIIVASVIAGIVIYASPVTLILLILLFYPLPKQ